MQYDAAADDGAVQKRYVYDLRGNIVKVIDAKGMLTGASDEERIGEFYTYNYSGWLLESRRPVSEEDGEVRCQLIQYQYDSRNRRIYEKQKINDHASRTLRYIYDAAGRLTELNRNSGIGNTRQL